MLVYLSHPYSIYQDFGIFSLIEKYLNYVYITTFTIYIVLILLICFRMSLIFSLSFSTQFKCMFLYQ